MTQTPDAILNRHARAIRILTCLQSGPGFNARELAHHLGVSRRTIYRDLCLIRQAGVRIRFDERQAAYRLERDSQQHLLPTVEPNDLVSLCLAAEGTVWNESDGFHGELREAMTKLLCLFPDQVRNRITRMLSSCFFHRPDWNIEERDWRVAQLVLSAIGDQVCIRATVNDAAGRRRTKISPYRLDVAPGSLRLTGRSSFDARRITIAVRDMQDVELTDIGFEQPRAARFLDPVLNADERNPSADAASQPADASPSDRVATPRATCQT